MSIYFRRKVSLLVSQKQSGLDVVFKRGESDVRFDALDELSECSIRKLKIPIPTVDLDILDGDEIAEGRVLYIETDTEITVKLSDTSDTGFPVKPIVSATGGLASKPGTLYLEGSFDHVYISVAGVSGDANLMVGILGE